MHAAVGIVHAFLDIGARLFKAAPWRLMAVTAIEAGELARGPDRIAVLERALVIAHAHFRRIDLLLVIAAALQLGEDILCIRHAEVGGAAEILLGLGLILLKARAVAEP